MMCRLCPRTPVGDLSGLNNKPGDDGLCLDEALIIFQQPLDVIEFDLRALRIGEAAAEFFQNAANPLHIDFAGDLHRIVVAVFVALQRPSKRIGTIGAALLPANAIARTIAPIRGEPGHRNPGRPSCHPALAE